MIANYTKFISITGLKRGCILSVFLLLLPLSAKESIGEIHFDLMYLRPFQDGLAYIWVPKSSGSDDLVELGKVISKSPDFSSDLGFRVGLSVPIYARDWHFSMCYTNFCGENSGSEAAAQAKLIPLLTLGTITSPDFEVAKSGKAKLDTRLDMGDATVKFRKSFGSDTQITPFMGLKILSLEQDYIVKYEEVSNGSFFLGNQTFKGKTDWINFGPLIGIELDWNFWSKFHLFGRGAGALLGKEINQSSTFISESDDLSLKLVCNKNSIKPCLESSAGLSFQRQLPKWKIEIKAAYEVFYFFKSYLFISSKGDSNFYDLSLMGVTGSIGIGY